MYEGQGARFRPLILLRERVELERARAAVSWTLRGGARFALSGFLFFFLKYLFLFVEWGFRLLEDNETFRGFAVLSLL